MRISIKEVSFAVFFLIVIALVAVEAAESYSEPVDHHSQVEPQH